MPFTFCLSGCPRRHGRRTRAEADPQCAHDGYRRGTTLPAPALRAMRFVFLQSAIQNPESRIQNHVSALRRCQLGHGHGQAIGARMRGSAPWKTEETIVGLPRSLVLSVLLTVKIFEACANFLTPDGLGSCRKRRNFGAHRSLVQSCGCGLAALGSPDLILQIWWLSPFTSSDLVAITFHLLRSDSPDLVAVTFSPPLWVPDILSAPPYPPLALFDSRRRPVGFLCAR